jgi:hypothetical protein
MINVFPVPDGDTGTNLSMTLSAVLPRSTAKPLPHAGAAAGAHRRRRARRRPRQLRRDPRAVPARPRRPRPAHASRSSMPTEFRECRRHRRCLCPRRPQRAARRHPADGAARLRRRTAGRSSARRSHRRLPRRSSAPACRASATLPRRHHRPARGAAPAPASSTPARRASSTCWKASLISCAAVRCAPEPTGAGWRRASRKRAGPPRPRPASMPGTPTPVTAGARSAWCTPRRSTTAGCASRSPGWAAAW